MNGWTGSIMGPRYFISLVLSVQRNFGHSVYRSTFCGLPLIVNHTCFLAHSRTLLFHSSYFRTFPSSYIAHFIAVILHISQQSNYTIHSSYISHFIAVIIDISQQLHCKVHSGYIAHFIAVKLHISQRLFPNHISFHTYLTSISYHVTFSDSFHANFTSFACYTNQSHVFAFISYIHLFMELTPLPCVLQPPWCKCST